MTDPRDDYWYDQFWEGVETDEDDGVSAVRLLGEMLDDEVIRRDGDWLVGRPIGKRTFLTTGDQHLIRRIEDAVAGAQETP